MRRLIALAIALLLIIGACGDGDTGDDGPADQGDPTQTTQPDTIQPDDGSDETNPPTDEGDDSGDSEGSGPSTATVTIGDKTYNFSTEGAIVAQCLTDLYGIISIGMPMIDESGAQADGGVGINILRKGTDPGVVERVNTVTVNIGDGYNWVADPAHVWYLLDGPVEPVGMSQVDSVEIDGRTVRGTATFSRDTTASELETMTGTFEATCGEERLS